MRWSPRGGRLKRSILKRVGAGFLYKQIEERDRTLGLYSDRIDQLEQELHLQELAHGVHIGRLESQVREYVHPTRLPEQALIAAIKTGLDTSSSYLSYLAEQTEKRLATDLTIDRVSVHRDIGRAIFERSPELYSGQGLSEYLKRYTYPPVLSIAFFDALQCSFSFFCRRVLTTKGRASISIISSSSKAPSRTRATSISPAGASRVSIPGWKRRSPT